MKMKYSVKEKLFAIGNDFNLRDEDGKQALFFDGHALSYPKTTKIYNNKKECVGKIVEEIFAIKDKYRLVVDKKIVARVIKNWTLISKEFVMRVEGEGLLIRFHRLLPIFRFVVAVAQIVVHLGVGGVKPDRAQVTLHRQIQLPVLVISDPQVVIRLVELRIGLNGRFKLCFF